MSDKSWDEMSRSERKVALALDVLAKIEADVIDVRQGSYVLGDITPGTGTVTKLDCSVIYEHCEMCAKGALLISRIDKFNTIEWDDLVSLDEDTWSLSDGSTYNGLKDAFTQQELDLIELAFEGWGASGRTEMYDSELVFKCTTAFSCVTPPSYRLKAICENIVKNGGEFNPSELGNNCEAGH